MGNETKPDIDVAVVGAGMAGLYLIHRCRELGLSVRAFDTADDVGGTWYWNRYPGARCDIQSVDYSYSWDPDLEAEWQWTEKYATQPEILRYLQHVADRHDLRRDITFGTRVDAAEWDDGADVWRLRTSGDETVAARFYVMATGCLSVPKSADIDGVDRFDGDVYVTGRWPHDGVDFSGKRVAVIGTGSSGIQSIPLIAEEAAELVVFQRTPNYSMPAGNGPIPETKLAAFRADPAAYRDAARHTRAGVDMGDPPLEGALSLSDDERLARFERAWAAGELLAPATTCTDLLLSPDANATFAEFVRDKIRAIVDDPETAETLCPTDHPYGTKRPCLDTRYYETFNLPHVRVVDLRREPISAITERGIDTVASSYEFDAIVFATGFDAMTGALVNVDITGRDGITLRDTWDHGPVTYLGLMTVGFPNLFMITGPGSPSVLSNMAVSIEQHVEWVTDAIAAMRADGHTAIEPTPTAQAGWVRHVNDCADITLFPTANSWYMGANVPGKPRVFLPYVGGVDVYRATCDRVADDAYLGFRRSGPAGEECNDGVVNRLQPDVALMLDTMAQLGLPPLDTLPVADARAFNEMIAAQRPPGPDVATIVDGVYPGAVGNLSYRLYVPDGTGPHPVVLYFHGGGWVLGHASSDDPFCRYLCDRTGAMVMSADYRHAPEHRFPAAHADAVAAASWLAEHVTELGGRPGPFAVAGWSAGANLAAWVSRHARDTGGPEIAGQLLVTPVTDCDLMRPSYSENADGYVLTLDLMRWFLDHYADPDDRSDPRLSVLRADDLTGLPAAMIVTAEFDPLRDEGAAYADALAEAGNDVEHLACRGQIHTSLTAVDLMLSSRDAREQMAAALREFLTVAVVA